MKEFKFCKFCKTNNDKQNDMCYKCGNKLEDVVYKKNTTQAVIISSITAILFLIISKTIFESYGSELVFLEIIFAIALVTILYGYFVNILSKYENISFYGYLDFIDSLRRILFFAKRSEYPYSQWDGNNKMLPASKIFALANNKIVYTIVYSGLICIWIILWSWIHIVKFKQIYIWCIMIALINSFVIPFVLLTISLVGSGREKKEKKE